MHTSPPRFSSSVVAFFVAGALLAGCAAGGDALAPSAPIVALPFIGAVAASLPATAPKNLYVANYGSSTVTVYALGSTTSLRTISQGVRGPHALTFDHAGNLYVANASGDSVTVYAPGSKNVLRKLTQGFNDRPSALAIDASDNLYVANCGPPNFYAACEGGDVTVYASGRGIPLRAIDTARPSALAFDNSGDLYVAHNPIGPNAITVYASGSKHVLRKITRGLKNPLALALDGSGNLFVANCLANNIPVYAPGSKKVLRTISQGRIVRTRSCSVGVVICMSRTRAVTA